MTAARRIIQWRLFLVLCAGLAFCGCGGAAAQARLPDRAGTDGAPGMPAGQGRAGTADIPGADNSPLTGASADTEVWVTNSGRRYHRENCGALRSSRIAVTLASAVKSGYGPCTICDPPVFPETAGANAGPDNAKTPALYRVNQTGSQNGVRARVRSRTGGIAETGGVDFSRLLPAEVTGHVDGDTIRVRIDNPPAELRVVETIRLIGVDTPETVHPRREVETFGREASDFTKSRLLGKTVYLAFDWDLRDRYGRLLAYIYTQDQRCHNAELVRQGYGHAYTRFPFQFMEEFRVLEKEARENRRGLWGQ